MTHGIVVYDRRHSNWGGLGLGLAERRRAYRLDQPAIIDACAKAPRWKATLAGDVRQRMIEAAMHLIASKGVQATSFADVLESSGAPRGSLYHHFPGGKDELVLAAMDNAMEMARAAVERARGARADKVAEAFIGFWRDVLTHSRLGSGCALLAVTLAPDTPAQRARAGEMFKSWRELLSSMLIEGGVRRARAPALAAGLLAACEGAVALARAEKSVKPFDLVVAEQLRSVRDAMR